MRVSRARGGREGRHSTPDENRQLAMFVRELPNYGVLAGGNGLMALSTPMALGEADEIVEAASHGIQRVAAAC